MNRVRENEWVFESSQEVQQALDALTSAGLSLGGMLRQAGVRTRIRSGNRILMSYSRPFVGNSWRPMFSGVVEGTPNGCRLRGRFRISRPAAAFMTFWFGFLVLWIIGATGAAVVKATQGGPQWNLFLLPLFGIGMAAFCVVMTSFGRHGMGERDEREIVACIERQCEAKIVQQPEKRRRLAAWQNVIARPVGWFDRFAAVFSVDVFRRLLSTPQGIGLIVATNAGQLPALLAFRHEAQAGGGLAIAAWLVLMVATILGLVGLVSLAERRTRTVVAIAAIQLLVLAPVGFVLLALAHEAM